jgi:demethylmenaquinone methyltransferase / 2-methoxy-6-polyprenyl-1,4-benzoquinol methylase
MAARQGAGAPQGGAAPGSSPQEGRLEARQVRAMFDRISGVYDLLNTAMTAGLHHRWRERAAEEAEVGPGSRVLDVATGTGDLALELARRVGPGGEVIGSDFAEGMLDRARIKAGSGGPAAATPRFEWGDAMALPYGDDSFDAATVGFGARNFDDLGRGLSEMVRVVRPRGRVVVLEITTPTRAPLSLFYRLWFDRLVPALGLATGKLEARRSQGKPGGEVSISDAYTYLPNSVKRFPDPPALAAELERAGLTDISYLLIAGGIVAIHAGTVVGDGR